MATFYISINLRFNPNKFILNCWFVKQIFNHLQFYLEEIRKDRFKKYYIRNCTQYKYKYVIRILGYLSFQKEVKNKVIMKMLGIKSVHGSKYNNWLIQWDRFSRLEIDSHHRRIFLFLPFPTLLNTLRTRRLILSRKLN